MKFYEDSTEKTRRETRLAHDVPIEAHRRKERRDERQDSRDRIDYTSQAAGYQDQKHLKRRVECFRDILDVV
jgi:hypothetical protein